ncbi:hypothetical protein Leryth_021984 [Lithospermum erythrorhizon]|nr:hypothetical protein Leryth_021984 [Lithospermum erythrorhizon]
MVGEDGVAIITINNPPLNLLSMDVMISLKESIEEASSRDDVKAIVLTGRNGKFSAGFQLTTFGNKERIKTRRELGYMSIEVVTGIIEACRKPLVAAIEGPSFGGGLEIALACHARISTSTAQLGLTELQYGILPGFGGTQRLPRLVGLSKALEMILTSKRVNGNEAQLLGLVDVIVPSYELLSTAREWALDIQNCRRPWAVSLFRTDRLSPLSEARTICRSARDLVQKQSPNLIHLLVCIDVIEEGIVNGPLWGLWKEAEALQELRQSNTCRSLIHIFFAQRQIRKIPGITDKGLRTREINKIAIISAGVVGSMIASALILRKFHVILKEEDEVSLLNGIKLVEDNLHRWATIGKISSQMLENSITFLDGVVSYDHFKDVDLVIETTSDTLLKQQIFADLEAYCSQQCILACSTSNINVNLLGEKTKSSNRIVGLHFMSPAPGLPLLEIVYTEKTSPQVIVDLMGFSSKLGKTPVVLQSFTGIVNRMLCLYFQAALFLIDYGIDVYQIDQALTTFGMQFGPFRMIDLLGLGISAAQITQFVECFPGRSYNSILIPIMQENGCEGESNRKGFYVYDDQLQATANKMISVYIRRVRNRCDEVESRMMKFSAEEISEMVLFPVVNETYRIIGDGVSIRDSDLDVASLGMGFPAYRGGVVYWSNVLGHEYICSKLLAWSKMHSNFFEPCPYFAKQVNKTAAKSQL